MKKICANLPLLDQQKKGIAILTSSLFNHLFTHKLNKSTLLDRINLYYREEILNDLILKQTLIKGLLPKTTWTKGDILKAGNFSTKLDCEMPKEPSDVRAITEAFTANYIAIEHNNIKKITLLSEQDKKKNTQILVSSTNKNPDAKIYIESNRDTDLHILSDVKSGNNSMHFFDNIMSVVPMNLAHETNSILNTKAVSGSIIQAHRLAYIKTLSLKANNVAFDDLYFKCLSLKEQEQNIVLCNILIQEEILNFIGHNPLVIAYFKPSLYSFKVGQQGFVNEDFFNAIKPHINNAIFNDYPNYRKYIKYALIAYDAHVKKISDKVLDASTCWGDSGFNLIAEDLFEP